MDTRERPGGVFRWIVTGVLTIAIVVGAYLAAHAYRPLSPPRFTERDYPPPPPAADNAFELMWPAASTLPSVHLSFPPPAASFASDPVEIAAALAAVGDKLVAIRSRSRMIETCVPSLTSACPGVALRRFTALRAASVLWSASDGHLEESLRHARIDWEHAVDYGSACRSLVSCMLAVRMREFALHAIEALLEVVGADPVLVPEGAAGAWRALTGSVGRSAPPVSLEYAVVGEYLTARPALVDRMHRPLLLDIGLTESMYAERCVRLRRFALEPSAALERSIDASVGSWAYNRDGAGVLAMAGPDAADLTSIRSAEASVERLRLAVVARLQGVFR